MQGWKQFACKKYESCTHKYPAKTRIDYTIDFMEEVEKIKESWITSKTDNYKNISNFLQECHSFSTH